VYICLYTNSDHQWCWEWLEVEFGNAIDVIMNGYQEMVKNHYVVQGVRHRTGIDLEKWRLKNNVNCKRSISQKMYFKKYRIS